MNIASILLFEGVLGLFMVLVSGAGVVYVFWRGKANRLRKEDETWSKWIDESSTNDGDKRKFNKFMGKNDLKCFLSNTEINVDLSEFPENLKRYKQVS